jgi:hypothetical protein
MSSREGYGISATNPEGFVPINSRFLPDHVAICGRAFSNGLIKVPRRSRGDRGQSCRSQLAIATRQRTLPVCFAAAEALVLGRGRVSLMARTTGLMHQVIDQGQQN